MEIAYFYFSALAGVSFLGAFALGLGYIAEKRRLKTWESAGNRQTEALYAAQKSTHDMASQAHTAGEIAQAEIMALRKKIEGLDESLSSLTAKLSARHKAAAKEQAVTSQILDRDQISMFSSPGGAPAAHKKPHVWDRRS